MSKQCAICGKGGMMVQKLKKLRGKYNPTIKKRKYPNLQWVRLASGPPKFYKGKSWRTGQRVLACAKCIKATSKTK